ncbi:BURP domain-containing protein 3 [Bienertia sinuspersici]
MVGSNDRTVKLNPHYKLPTIDEHPAIDDCIFFWGKEVNNSQIPRDGRAVYFTNDESFTIGKKLKLHFKNIDNKAKFLPLPVSKSLPIASDKLQEVLNILSVNPKSILAQDIEITMKKCEEKGVKGENRYCATSLEAMVDYVTLILNSGKNKLKVLATKEDNGVFMEYKIEKVHKLEGDDNHNMVCHKLGNPYVVFFCHNVKNTHIYEVSLVGANGNQTKAVAVCHKDTSHWNPRHYAFELLKTKPGGKPVCHFLSADAIAFLPN